MNNRLLVIFSILGTYVSGLTMGFTIATMHMPTRFYLPVENDHKQKDEYI